MTHRSVSGWHDVDVCLNSLPLPDLHFDPSGTSVPEGDADGRVTSDGPLVGRLPGDSECTHPSVPPTDGAAPDRTWSPFPSGPYPLRRGGTPS